MDTGRYPENGRLMGHDPLAHDVLPGRTKKSDRSYQQLALYAWSPKSKPLTPVEQGPSLAAAPFSSAGGMVRALFVTTR